MRSRHLLPALLGFSGLLALSACSGGDGPTAPKTTSVRLNICPYGLTWAAYRNEGAAWVKVDVGSNGEITFDATDKVSFAYVLAGGSVAYTQVFNTTTAELLAVNDMPCTSVYGIRSLTGSVAGLTGGQTADLAAGYSLTTTNATTTNWTLGQLPDVGAVDVVALRYATSTAGTPDKVILRRGVVPGSGGVSIGALDFAGAEAMALESATMTLNNAGSDVVYVQNYLLTANVTDTRIDVKYVTAAPYTASVVYLPASLRIGTDRHELDVYAIAGSALRAIIQYNVAPTNRTLTFGPALAASTVSEIATTPYRRFSGTVASQTEYGSGVRLIVYQQPTPTSLREVIVTTTAGYLGGMPATWTVEVPDFVAGYNSNWGLTSGAYQAQVAAFQGDLRYEGNPADGTTILMAVRNTSASAIELSRNPAALRRITRP